LQALQNLNLASLLDTFVSVATAFLLGGLIGFERQVRQRTAGLRTNTLVAVGAAVFVCTATTAPSTWRPTWSRASASWAPGRS
jgi:uncharacterized membrane protein YhiD involved in acid resistance